MPETAAHTGARAGLDDGAITVPEWVYRQLKARILIGQFVPGRSVTLRAIADRIEHENDKGR